MLVPSLSPASAPIWNLGLDSVLSPKVSSPPPPPPRDVPASSANCSQCLPGQLQLLGSKTGTDPPLRLMRETDSGEVVGGHTRPTRLLQKSQICSARTELREREGASTGPSGRAAPVPLEDRVPKAGESSLVWGWGREGICPKTLCNPGWASKTAQWVKVLAAEACSPKFNPWNPHEGGERKVTPHALWTPSSCCGINVLTHIQMPKTKEETDL